MYCKPLEFHKKRYVEYVEKNQIYFKVLKFSYKRIGKIFCLSSGPLIISPCLKKCIKDTFLPSVVSI